MDEVVDLNALKVIIDKKSVLYLYGTELDYSDGLNGKGFNWINPQASRTCGCGESFAL
jgi:iron-sulfur cluster assembly protein